MKQPSFFIAFSKFFEGSEKSKQQELKQPSKRWTVGFCHRCARVIRSHTAVKNHFDIGTSE